MCAKSRWKERSVFGPREQGLGLRRAWAATAEETGLLGWRQTEGSGLKSEVNDG